MPSGKPAVKAPRADFDWERVRSDVRHVLPRNESTEVRLAQWDSFVDARPKDLTQAQRVTTLPTWNYAMIPQTGSAGDDPRATAAHAVRDGLRVVTQPQTIACRALPGSGAEGEAERRACAAHTAESTMLPLTANGFGLVKMDYENDGGCQIPALLVQFPESFDGDTTKGETKVNVRWWEPQPSGTWDGEWRQWKDGRRRQLQSEIERREVIMLNVQFTRTEPLANGTRRLSTATKQRLAQDSFFQYTKYSSGPP